MYNGIEIKTLQKIRRFYPDCFTAVFEAAGKIQFNKTELNNLYGMHTFYYEKQSNKILYDKDGINVNVYFGRDPNIINEVRRRITTIGGIAVKEKKINDFNSLLYKIQNVLSDNKPLVCDFSLGFIKERREFGKVFTPHEICIVGIDQNNEEIFALEQILGLIKIHFNEMKKNVDYYKNNGVSIFEMSEVKPQYNYPNEIALNDIEYSIKNLESEKNNLGLNGLKEFTKDLFDFIDSNGKTPFSIPGIWCFSHERHVLPLYIKEIIDKNRIADLEINGYEAISINKKLFSKWYTIDMLLESNFANFNSRNLKKIKQNLRDIYDLELTMLSVWKKILKSIV